MKKMIQYLTSEKASQTLDRQGWMPGKAWGCLATVWDIECNGLPSTPLKKKKKT